MIPKKRQGQAAVEYMIVVAIGLFLLSPFLIKGYEYLHTLNDVSSTTTITNTLNKLSETIEAVHAQGPPSKIKIKIMVPSNTVSGEVDPSTDAIHYRLLKNNNYEDYARYFDFNINGELPTQPGVHIVLIEALEDEVNISVSS